MHAVGITVLRFLALEFGNTVRGFNLFKSHVRAHSLRLASVNEKSGALFLICFVVGLANQRRCVPADRQFRCRLTDRPYLVRFLCISLVLWWETRRSWRLRRLCTSFTCRSSRVALNYASLNCGTLKDWYGRSCCTEVCVGSLFL